jgi:hypothetical protein
MKYAVRAVLLAAIVAANLAMEGKAQVNPVPVAFDDEALPFRFGQTSGPLVVLHNDTDLGDLPVTLQITDMPDYGTVELCNSPGPGCPLPFGPFYPFQPYILYTYEDADAFPASDSLRYRITDSNGDMSNEATLTLPGRGAEDDFATTASGHVVTTNVLANDSPLLDQPLTVELAGAPVGGTATINPDYSISFEAADDFVGVNASAGGVVYRVRDADGDESTAVLSVNVFPPPTTDNGGSALDPWLLLSGGAIAVARRRRVRQLAKNGAGGGT